MPSRGSEKKAAGASCSRVPLAHGAAAVGVAAAVFLVTACRPGNVSVKEAREWAGGYETPQVKEVPPQRDYDAVKRGVHNRRSQLVGRLYRASDRTTAAEQTAVEFGRLVVDEIIPFWYGTPWDYNGTTRTPGQGHIACGYFVTTVLRDAGVPLDRVALARAASETMIKALVPERYIERYSGVPVESFEEAMRRKEPGLYIVGLDHHTGFIHVADGEARFIHSAPPVGVVNNAFADAPHLADSRYRVVGRISTADFVNRHWLSLTD